MSAKKPYRLTAAFVSSVTRPGRYGDRRGGHGLTLRVKPTQSGGWSRTFSQRIRINGKPFQTGLGSYPVVTLARARELALDNARRVERGEDIRKPATPVPTLFEAFDIVIENSLPKWWGDNTLGNWLRSKQVFAEIGSLPVSAVESKQVQDILAGILHQNKSTAYKARSHLSCVMRWAMTQGYRSTNPAPSDILAVFGRPSPPVHHRTMPYKDLGKALAKFRDAENIWWASRFAIIFLALTGVAQQKREAGHLGRDRHPQQVLDPQTYSHEVRETVPSTPFQTGLAGLGVRQTPRQRNRPNLPTKTGAPRTRFQSGQTHDKTEHHRQPPRLPSVHHKLGTRI